MKPIIYGAFACVVALVGCQTISSLFLPSEPGPGPASQDQIATAASYGHEVGEFEVARPRSLHRHHTRSFDERVEAVQRALQDRHYYWGKIDGVDGPNTIKAVGDFQKDLEVPVTGVADDKTLAALDVR